MILFPRQLNKATDAGEKKTNVIYIPIFTKYM